MFRNNLKKYGAPVVLVSMATAALPAAATEPTGLSGLVPSYDDVGPQLIATGSAIAGVLVTFVGVRWILRMIKGG